MAGVCVIGLGLIGGSLLRAAAASGHETWGATASPVDMCAAHDAGYHVESTEAALRRAADRDALVVLAVPLTALREPLSAVAELAPRCRLTDVISVKRPVADAVRRIAPSTRYVGGHPMAGRAASGWVAGSETLFHQAAWVVAVEDDTDPETWRDVAALALDCGAHVVPAGPDEHDTAVARISHLPHVLAAVLAAVGADGGPLAWELAAGSFRDATRVAATRPELVQAMCEGNRRALLPAIDDALGRLGAARGSLASSGSLAATIRTGHDGRVSLDNHRPAERQRITIDVTTPAALARLRAYGDHGGRLVGLEGTRAMIEVDPAAPSVDDH